MMKREISGVKIIWGNMSLSYCIGKREQSINAKAVSVCNLIDIKTDQYKCQLMRCPFWNGYCPWTGSLGQASLSKHICATSFLVLMPSFPPWIMTVNQGHMTNLVQMIKSLYMRERLQFWQNFRLVFKNNKLQSIHGIFSTNDNGNANSNDNATLV